MNSKERVIAAIERKPVDMTPLGFYAVDHDMIAKVIGRPTLIRNKVETQIAIWEGRRDDLLESYKNDSIDFYKKIDCADLILFKDVPLLPPKGYTPDPPKKIGDYLWEDKKGRIWKANPDANDIMIIKDAPVTKEYCVEDFEIPETFDAPDESIFEAFDHFLSVFGNDKYISNIMTIEPMPFMSNFERAMETFALNPEVVHAANKYHVAYWNAMDKYYNRPGISGAHAEEDMAGTNSPFVSPRMFRKLFYPYLKERITNIKKYVDRISFHCCGKTTTLMDMFIDAGVDCYQSLQTNAGMEIGFLKKTYGDKMSFWGGFSLENLIVGSTDDVRKEVRTALERGAGTGFILGPSHSIAFGSKYDNFMAMLDEFVKYRDRFGS